MSSSLSPSPASGPNPQSDQDYEIYPISLATDSVNKAIARVTKILEERKLPHLKSGEITFKTTVTTGWSLGLSFFVLTFLFSRKHSTVSEVTVHYEKDKPKGALTPELALIHHPKNKWVALEDELVKQIEEVAQATASTDIGGLPLQQFSVSVQFGIDWKIDGSVKTPTLVAVTADASKENNNVHSVKLTFENPASGK